MMQIRSITNGVLVGALAAFTASAATAENNLQIEEIVVTAQKREQSIQDVPVSVTAITAETISSFGLQSTGDIARLSSSLTVTESNNKTNSAFSIRGIGTNLFGIGIEQGVAVIVDDVSKVQQGQGLANMVDIERIEVLRGPQSTLFGQASSAGVISITTKGPSDEFEGSVELTATDENYYKVMASVSGPISDNAGFRLTAHSSDLDGWVDNLATGVDDFNSEESKGFSGKLYWEINDNVDLQLKAYVTEEESQCCARVLGGFEPGAALFGAIPQSVFAAGVNATDDNTTVRYDTLPNSDNDSQGVSARLSVDIGDFQLISITAYDEWDYTNSEDVDLSELDVLAIFTGGAVNGNFYSDSVRELEFFSQELRLLSPTYDNYDYLLGFYYSDTDVDRSFFRILPVAPANFDAFASNENYAVFGQLNWRPSEKTTVSVGLRYVDEEMSTVVTDFAVATPITIDADDDDNAVTGKISIQRFLNDNSMVFASYTRGHKAQAYDITAGFSQSNADNPIKPETADAFEIGIKSTLWDQRMQLNVTAFQTTYDDFQVQTAITTGPTIVFRKANVGELETKGLEIESLTLLSERFSLIFNAAYIDAVVNDYGGAQCYRYQTEAQGCIAGFPTVDGGDLPNSPEWKYTIAHEYQQGLVNLPFDLYANVLYVWQDEISFGLSQAPFLKEDSYGIANLRFGIVDKEDRYELTAFVNNAFDESYRSELIDFGVLFGNTTALVHITPRNAERYAGLTAKYKF